MIKLGDEEIPKSENIKVDELINYINKIEMKEYKEKFNQLINSEIGYFSDMRIGELNY